MITQSSTLQQNEGTEQITYTTETSLTFASLGISILFIIFIWIIMVSEYKIKGKIAGDNTATVNKEEQLIGTSIISLFLSLALVVYYLYNKSYFNIFAIIFIALQVIFILPICIGIFFETMEPLFKYLSKITSRTLVASILLLIVSCILIVTVILGYVKIEKTDKLGFFLMLTAVISLILQGISQMEFILKNQSDKGKIMGTTLADDNKKEFISFIFNFASKIIFIASLLINCYALIF